MRMPDFVDTPQKKYIWKNAVCTSCGCVDLHLIQIGLAQLMLDNADKFYSIIKEATNGKR